MSNEDKDKTIEDMSLSDDVKHPPELNMDLSGPDVVNVGQRIQKLFPAVDVVDLIDNLKIMKMADGSYTVGGKKLEELAKMDLQKIDDFLKEEEAKK